MMQSLHTLLMLSNNSNTLRYFLQLTHKNIISNNDHEQHDHNNNNQNHYANTALVIVLKSYLITHSYYLENYHS